MAVMVPRATGLPPGRYLATMMAMRLADGLVRGPQAPRHPRQKLQNVILALLRAPTKRIWRRRGRKWPLRGCYLA